MAQRVDQHFPLQAAARFEQLAESGPAGPLASLHRNSLIENRLILGILAAARRL
jgi:hypothetical protein